MDYKDRLVKALYELQGSLVKALCGLQESTC